MEILTFKSSDPISIVQDILIGFRPNLDLNTLQDEVQEMMTGGYRLIYIIDDITAEVAGFAGYRYLQTLKSGKMIYIDDLFTLAKYRGKGYAGALLGYIHQEAEQTGMKTVHLDSGFSRHDAHRLYLNKGYVIECLHFSRSFVL